MKIQSLAGYTQKGFADDAKKWFPKTERCEVEDKKIRKLSSFIEHLDEKHHATMKALDAMVRGKKFPSIQGVDVMDDWTYGFDFAKNDVEILDEEGEPIDASTVWSLACDGGGNHYMVTSDGRVVVWNHEEGNIEDHTQFANIDVFLWVMLRLAAIEEGKLAKKDVEKDIRSLKQGGANFLLDRT